MRGWFVSAGHTWSHLVTPGPHLITRGWFMWGAAAALKAEACVASPAGHSQASARGQRRPEPFGVQQSGGGPTGGLRHHHRRYTEQYRCATSGMRAPGSTWMYINKSCRCELQQPLALLQDWQNITTHQQNLHGKKLPVSEKFTALTA